MSNGASNRSFNSDIPEARWDSTFRERPAADDRRLEQPHACEHCGRVMQYADQMCACTSRRP